MSKPHHIRKKALEFAKKRQWDKAIDEYIQLAEIEANNPNVFNELGDLHLKMGNKGDAFRAFHSATDAYTRMGLFNNAVAVCKKIIRLSPSDSEVYGKLARLRNQQGIKREAAAYAVTFLEKIATDPTVEPEETKKDLIELAGEMGHAPEVLERIAEFLLAQQFTTEAGRILEKLAHLYASQGMSAEADRAVKRMDEIGFTPAEPLETSKPVGGVSGSFDGASLGSTAQAPRRGHGTPADPYDFNSVELGQSPEPRQATAATQTEEVDAADAESPRSAAQQPPPSPETVFETDTDRIDIPPVGEGGSADEFAARGSEREFITGDPLHSSGESPVPDPPSVSETRAADGFYDIPTPGDEETPPEHSDSTGGRSADGVFDIPAPEAVPETQRPADDGTGEVVYDIPSDEPPGSEHAARDSDAGSQPETSFSAPEGPPTEGTPGPHSGPSAPLEEGEVWIPKDELPGGVVSKDDGDGGVVKMSDLVGHFNAEVKADVDAEDYRSHYDLGMAYLEMDLITEAIREFQFAANSSMYRARSLELIGMCFIKQSQPKLAIKQLEKGLELLGAADRDSIGLHYNLGLAYEMIGDREKAKHCFEEVYVFDVSFRDIAEKIKEYSS
jgi:tetratricopeptide (TPR) repeat protein